VTVTLAVWVLPARSARLLRPCRSGGKGGIGRYLEQEYAGPVDAGAPWPLIWFEAEPKPAV
jgi:hypothetical protein